MLLGVKRHPQLTDEIWGLINEFIKDNDMAFFANHYKHSFKDIREMMEITSEIIGPLSETYVAGKLLDMGIFSEWIQIAEQLFNGTLEDQALTLNFLGQMMAFLPDAVSQNE